MLDNFKTLLRVSCECLKVASFFLLCFFCPFLKEFFAHFFFFFFALNASQMLTSPFSSSIYQYRTRPGRIHRFKFFFFFLREEGDGRKEKSFLLKGYWCLKQKKEWQVAHEVPLPKELYCTQLSVILGWGFKVRIGGEEEW